MPGAGATLARSTAPHRDSLLVVIVELKLRRSDFLHGLARCPNCALSLDPITDVDEELREVREVRPVGARMTHRRCGASFQVSFDL